MHPGFDMKVDQLPHDLLVNANLFVEWRNDRQQNSANHDLLLFRIRLRSCGSTAPWRFLSSPHMTPVTAAWIGLSTLPDRCQSFATQRATVSRQPCNA